MSSSSEGAAGTRPLAIAFAGLLSLAIAMGIGRFAFTPLLPMMLHDGVVDLGGASWLATANYLGYWLGAMACALQPTLWRRWGLRRPLRHPAVVRAGLVATVLLTLGMALPGAALWPLWRGLAGVASALVFVYVSGWCLARLSALGAPALAGIIYVGPGLGITASGLAASAMVAQGLQAATGWAVFALLAAVLTALAWPQLSGAVATSAAASADDAPPGSPAVDPSRAPADVFYVHPTSYVGPRWNAPVDDRALNEATDAVATRLQASAFNACCAVYGPRYRQANGTAFIRPSADGDRAIDVAYGDVRRAFRAFLRRRGDARPFILASHSQGSVLAERLLVDEVSNSPLRARLVAAYLLGANVSAERLAARAPDLLPCRAADDLRCVVAYNARRVGYVVSDMELARRDASPRLCTNPLTWRDDGASGPTSLHLGAVFLESDDRRVRRGYADARCVGEALVVTRTGEIPRDAMSRVLDRVLGEGNLHPVEYQLFYMNLRANAQRRVAAMTAAPP
jgi:hypothetical protein